MTRLAALLAVGIVGSSHAAAQGTEYPAVKFRSNYLSSYYISHAPTTTPWAPCWSPDGKWIAVSLYGSIWKVDPRAGEAYELTHATKLHSNPSWSPDGKWIVYTSDDNWRSVGLEILNVETGETRPLTGDKQVYLDPVFSPDGSRLAYVSTASGGNLNVAARPIHNGDWSGQEVRLTRDHRFGKVRPYFDDFDLHIEPAWLKDGRELLLVSNRGVPLGSGKLWRAPAAPDAMSSARAILDEQSLYQTRPDVSPDGKRVVYSSSAGAADQFNHLYLLPVSGGQPYKLTFGDHDDFRPRWSPDGQWIAYVSNKEGLPELYLLEIVGGAEKKVELKTLHWKQPMGAVRVSIRDEAGHPLEARISGKASDGKLYGPRDAFIINARLAGEGRPGAGGVKRIFYTSGSYTTQVPPGPLTVEARRGYEHWPASKQVEIRSGEAAEVTLTLKRRIDMPAKGWINGSTHVHMNYGGILHNTPERLMLMARAEGMYIVSDLIANKDNRVLDWQYFRKGGQAYPVPGAGPRSLLLFGEENRPPFWGHTSYIGLTDHLISPFATGYEGTAVDSLFPSNSDLFEKARAQGAATAYVHAFGGDRDPLAGEGIAGAKGFAVDLALGLIDAVEWAAVNRATLVPLFHAWNNDFHLTPVGGEDALANMQDYRPVGIIRTYAQLGPQVTPEAWVNAIKQGHTVMTNGPLVTFTVNGKPPGESISLPATGKHEVLIEGDVWSCTPVRRALVYHDGQLQKEIHPNGDRFAIHVSERASVEGSGWFSLVAEADDPDHPQEMFAQAVTNCVRVYVGSGKIRNAESAAYFLKWIDRLRAMTQAPNLWRTPAEREHVFAQFDRAANVYRQRQREAKP